MEEKYNITFENDVSWKQCDFGFLLKVAGDYPK